MPAPPSAVGRTRSSAPRRQRVRCAPRGLSALSLRQRRALRLARPADRSLPEV